MKEKLIIFLLLLIGLCMGASIHKYHEDLREEMSIEKQTKVYKKHYFPKIKKLRSNDGFRVRWVAV